MSKKIQIPTFDTKEELFEFLVENKDILITQKKSEIKHSDAFLYVHALDEDGKLISNKAGEPVDMSSATELKVKVIINTTNLMDGHDDVHMPNLWNKSLKENKMIMHLQEHSMTFDKIISEGSDLKAFTKTFSWKELGYGSYPGNTQALVFNSTIKKDRNPFMFDQYAKGYVKNHSVGMRYMKLVLAVNNENYGAEFEAWEKYIDKVANRAKAEDKGYFWVVKEAKVIEGSAVPLGSNWITPTLEVNAKGEIIEVEEVKYLQDIFNAIPEPQKKSDTSTPSTQEKDIDFLECLKDKLN